jgi:hypothetical protein
VSLEENGIASPGSSIKHSPSYTESLEGKPHHLTSPLQVCTIPVEFAS